MKGYSMDWNGEKFLDLATKVNVVAMTKATAVVEQNVKKNFTLQGTGRTINGVWVSGAGWKRTKTGKKHYAAKAPAAPAVDYGALRASITSKVEEKGLKVHGYVGSDLAKIKEELSKRKAATGTDLEYGIYLELGTSKMKARPFLRPALRRCKNKIEKIFRAANGHS